MNEPLKIMHVVLSMGYGGLERIISELVKKDAGRSEIGICCLDRGGALLEELSAQGIRSHVLDRRPGKFDIRLAAGLTALLRREKIDLVHSHSGCSLYGALCGRLAGVKGIVHTDHGRLVPDRPGLVLEDRIAAKIINSYVAVSRELYEYLRTTVGISEKKLALITNGIDADRFRPCTNGGRESLRRELGLPDHAEVIGTVCRLDPVKNLVFFLEAASGLLRDRTETFFLIAGDGPELMHIRETIRGKGLEGRVVLLGERRDVERIMPAFDVFVLPSKSEGTSLTLLEAMACGVPVLASDVGGNPAVVSQGKSGFLFPLNRPEFMIGALKELLSDKTQARQIGMRGRERIEAEFSFSRMFERYHGLYRSLAC